MLGELSYVTAEDVESFGGEEFRNKAFSKQGWIGKYLRKLNMTAIVERTVFVHGG